MGLHVYKAGDLLTDPERDQMTRLIGYLSREFTNRREECIIVVEPHIPSILNGQSFMRKPDALIVKEKK
jgi:hypothetical protein